MNGLVSEALGVGGGNGGGGGGSAIGRPPCPSSSSGSMMDPNAVFQQDRGGIGGGDAMLSTPPTTTTTTSAYRVEDFLNVPVVSSDMANLLEREMEEILSSSSFLGGGGPMLGGASVTDADGGFLMRLDTPAPDELPNLDSFDPLNFGVSLDGSEFENKFGGGSCVNLFDGKISGGGGGGAAFSQFSSTSTATSMPLPDQEDSVFHSDFLFCAQQRETAHFREQHVKQLPQQQQQRQERSPATGYVDRAVYMTSPVSSYIYGSSHSMGTTAGGLSDGHNENITLMVDPQTGIPNRPMMLSRESNASAATSDDGNDVAGPVARERPEDQTLAPVSSGPVDPSANATQQCDRDVHMMSPPPVPTSRHQEQLAPDILQPPSRVISKQQQVAREQQRQPQQFQQPHQLPQQQSQLQQQSSRRQPPQVGPQPSRHAPSSNQVAAAADALITAKSQDEAVNNGNPVTAPQAWSQLQTILLSGSNGSVPTSLLQQLQPILAQQKAKNIIVQAKALTPSIPSGSGTTSTETASHGTSTPSFQTVQILKSGLAGALSGAAGGKAYVIRHNDVKSLPPATAATVASSTIMTAGSPSNPSPSSANESAAVISTSSSSTPSLHSVNAHHLLHQQLFPQQQPTGTSVPDSSFRTSPSDLVGAGVGGGSGGSVSSDNSDEDFPSSGDVATAATSVVAAAENPYPKPVYSYSCLIALALKNSKTGSLPVNEIYSFMTDNFPYFRTAPDGWKNSVRHNLSLNKCFEKIEKPGANGQNSRKGCFWSLNPDKLGKMEEEIIKWRKKDPQGVLRSMSYPEQLEMIEQGTITSTNYMQFSHFRDRRLLFQDSGADSTELSSSPSASTSAPAMPQAAATVIYPSGKQMVKMSDLGTALQKETITIKREENGEMVASVTTVPKTSSALANCSDLSAVSGSTSSVGATGIQTGSNGGNLTGTITTGNILASLGGLAGATSIKFSFSPTTGDGAGGGGGGGGPGAGHSQTAMTQIPIAKVVTMWVGDV